MTRLALVLFLSPVLIIGCDKNKKDQPDSKKTDSTKDDNKPKPDAFEASEDPPINADTYFAAGQLAETQGDLARAVKQYEQALKINPNHANSLFRLGALQTEMKQFNEAIATWQRYLKVTDNSAAGYSNLGFCYEQAGRFEEAEVAYKAGIARDPENAACRVNYGLMLARQDRLDDAITQLQTVLTPAEVHYNLGRVFEEKGKKDQARAYYQKALQLDPQLMDARSRLASLK